MDLASYQHLKLERQQGGILLVTLNRLEAANVLNTVLEDWDALGRGTAR